MTIQILPPQLANQIAAGEVVERPASVVKELVENSLDAKATKIEIDIEQGGASLIRIRDNGSGIAQAELVLALARHATSKISSLEELEAINSLGFRGEALASISSVSRLILTSRTADQTEAWQVYAEGREMETTVKPAAHPPGTTVEVRDLFYNTPGRRKFLRTGKTEFAHIDELIRRLALARFDVAITLQHNGKLTRQYRPVQDPAEREQRLAAVCGNAFMRYALALSWQHSDLAIEGWIVPPDGIKACPELQYCYVNGRIMRDRMINHAIRQAYQGHLTEGQQPVYILYLQVDPRELDVNVHPAKQEVRFHQSRLVHDFIYQAVLTALQSLPLPMQADEQGAQVFSVPGNRPASGKNQFAIPASQSHHEKKPQHENQYQEESQHQHENSYSYQHESRVGNKSAGQRHSAGRNHSSYARENSTGWQQQRALYQQLIQQPATEQQISSLREERVSVDELPPRQQEVSAILPSQQQGFGRVLTIIPPNFALLEYQQGIALLTLTVAGRYLRQAQLTPQVEGKLYAQPLLIPLQLKLLQPQYDAGRKQHELLVALGIHLDMQPPVQKQQRALLKAVPLPLRQQNLQQLLPGLLTWLSRQDSVTTKSAVHWLAEQTESEQQVHWSLSQAVQMLTEIERLCPDLIKQPPAELLQSVDIYSAITALQGKG